MGLSASQSNQTQFNRTESNKTGPNLQSIHRIESNRIETDRSESNQNNQSVNQSISQSANESINQPKKPIKRSFFLNIYQPSVRRRTNPTVEWERSRRGPGQQEFPVRRHVRGGLPTKQSAWKQASFCRRFPESGQFTILIPEGWDILLLGLQNGLLEASGELSGARWAPGGRQGLGSPRA